MGLAPRPVIDRMADKFTVGDDCWLWTGTRNTDGYGILWPRIRAHRAVYELLVGPVPDGLELDHLCRVRHCVRPSHLEPVTREENIRRGRAGALEAERTHCAQGHPYDAENTYVNPRGWRQCRTCHREWTRQRDKARRGN